ncbi:MAG: hypothetical protein GEV10_31095 [Streptosporangiales bacterium]|nr:hypothetical protein [Streptosporangiales bacterium]
MTRSRVFLAVGLVLLAVALVVPLGTLGALAGTSLPYQDPTPQLLDEQAARIASLQRDLAVRASISGILIAGSALTLVYARRRRRVSDRT